ncbi:hypothetical protein ANAPC5_01458 [Anaplasma phagocytophilum]|nr:hypothetical protein ANAPC5_01458 [Anaplasma phagocytophilum]
MKRSIVKNPESALSGDSGLLEGMRCAAHTLQLAVSDGLKGSGCGHIVEESRSLVKIPRV